MGKYIEEYLVGLGFELDSSEGVAYQKMLEDLEQKQKSMEDQTRKSTDTQKKEASKRNESRQQENYTLLDLEKTLKQISGLSSQLGSGNIFGSLVSGAASVSTLQKMFEGLQKSLDDADNSAKSTKRSIFDLFKTDGAKSKKEPGKQTEPTKKNTEPANEAAQYTSTAAEGKETGKGFQAGVVEEKALQAGITGETAGGMAATAEGAISTAASVALPVAIAAATTAAVVALSNMADSLASANVDVETMAKKFWITNENAWQLNNTLSAMGKTTSDLNDIALNDSLREQFNTLQEYQEAILSLPSDFESVNDQWVEGVDTANSKLSLTWAYLKEIAAYKISKTFEPIAENFLNNISGTIMEIGNVFGLVSDEDLESYLDSLVENSSDAVKEYWGGYATEQAEVSSVESAATTSSTSQPVISDYLNGANYAPQSSSYTASNSSSLQVDYSPQIQVYTQASDAQSVANSVSKTVVSDFDNIILTKNLQGMNR